MITLTGRRRGSGVRARWQGFTPYRRGAVGLGRLRPRPAARPKSDPGFRRARRSWRFWRGIFAARKLSTDWDSLKEAEDELLINSLSMLCPFAPEDKQALLEAPTLQTRRETLVTLMEFALRGGGDEEMLQ